MTDIPITIPGSYLLLTTEKLMTLVQEGDPIAILEATNRLNSIAGQLNKYVMMKMSYNDINGLDDMIYQTMSDFENLFWKSVN